MTKIETLIADLEGFCAYLRSRDTPTRFTDALINTVEYLRQADQQAQLYRATVIEECRQTIIDLRLPDCEWEKKYIDRFDGGVKAAIHQLNALLNPVEEIEHYDCPIHGLQDGPDCARC